MSKGPGCPSFQAGGPGTGTRPGAKSWTEDAGVVEAMQRGRSSPGYGDARFFPCHEAYIHSFEKRIADAVGTGMGLA